MTGLMTSLSLTPYKEENCLSWRICSRDYSFLCLTFLIWASTVIVLYYICQRIRPSLIYPRCHMVGNKYNLDMPAVHHMTVFFLIKEGVWIGICSTFIHFLFPSSHSNIKMWKWIFHVMFTLPFDVNVTKNIFKQVWIISTYRLLILSFIFLYLFPLGVANADHISPSHPV